MPRRWKRTHRRAGAASPGRSSWRPRLPCGVRRSPRCRSADATPRTAWAVLAPLWRRHARPCPDNPCQGMGWAWAAECVAARPDDESTGKMPGDSRTAIRLRRRARSPAFRSAQPLSHGECACCACRFGRSARMRARALPGPGPRLALAPAAPLDTRHHECHEHDDDQDPGLRPSGDFGVAGRRRRLNSRCLLLTAHRQKETSNKFLEFVVVFKP